MQNNKKRSNRHKYLTVASFFVNLSLIDKIDNTIRNIEKNEH
jgi:hypothetical protein